MAGVGAGIAILFILMLMLISIAICVVLIIAEWKLFKKAGQPGWAAIVPFYNVYILTKITWGNGWFFLLGFLPFGNILFLIFTWIKLAKAFGKGGGYAAGLFFLPFVFLPMLAFGGAVYQGPDQGSKKGAVIACAVLGGVGVLLYGVLLIVAVTAGVTQIRDTPPAYVEDYDDPDDLYEDGYDDPDDLYEDSYDDLDDLYDDSYDDYDDYGDIGSDVERTPIEGYDYFVNVALDNGDMQVSVPVPDSEYLSVAGGAASAIIDGVSVSVYAGYMYADLPQMVSDSVETTCDVMEDMPEYYADITVDEMIAGDGFALQQINYNYINWDGEKIPCIEIIKCDQVDDGMVMLDLSVDNSSATENTQTIFEEACALYGIDFDFD